MNCQPYLNINFRDLERVHRDAAKRKVKSLMPLGFKETRSETDAAITSSFKAGPMGVVSLAQEFQRREGNVASAVTTWQLQSLAGVPRTERVAEDRTPVSIIRKPGSITMMWWHVGFNIASAEWDASGNLKQISAISGEKAINGILAAAANGLLMWKDDKGNIHWVGSEPFTLPTIPEIVNPPLLLEEYRSAVMGIGMIHIGDNVFL